MKSPTGQEPARVGVRSTITGIFVNILLAAVKAIAGVAGNSYALVADAIESMFDVVTSLVVLGGLKIAAIPADENHPYGHGKAEPIAAAAVSITLCTAAIAIAIQSIREIVTPHHAPAPFTLGVLVAVIVTKEVLFRRVLKAGREIESTVVTTDAWHHRSDALTSSAAFVGIAVALIGGPGYESADDIAALFASVIIAVNGVRLLTSAIREIMDTAPHTGIEESVRSSARSIPGVVGLEKCNVRKMGLSYYVDLHVLVDGDRSVREGHEVAHRVKDAVIEANPRISNVLVHIEPMDAHPHAVLKQRNDGAG